MRIGIYKKVFKIVNCKKARYSLRAKYLLIHQFGPLIALTLIFHILQHNCWNYQLFCHGNHGLSNKGQTPKDFKSTALLLHSTSGK